MKCSVVSLNDALTFGNMSAEFHVMFQEQKEFFKNNPLEAVVEKVENGLKVIGPFIDMEILEKIKFSTSSTLQRAIADIVSGRQNLTDIEKRFNDEGFSQILVALLYLVSSPENFDQLNANREEMQAEVEKKLAYLKNMEDFFK